MHEISIISNVISTVEACACENNLNSVTCIYLEIGEFNFIKNNSLFFIFDIMKKETICDNAQLIINNIKGYELNIYKIEGE